MRLRGKGCWWKERNLAPEKLRQGKGQLVGKGNLALKYFRQNRCMWEEKGREPDAEVLSSKTKTDGALLVKMVIIHTLLVLVV